MPYFAQWSGFGPYLARHAHGPVGVVLSRLGYRGTSGTSDWKKKEMPLAALKAIIVTFNYAEADTIEKEVTIVEKRTGGRPVPALARQLAQDYDTRRRNIRWEAPLAGGGKVMLRVGGDPAHELHPYTPENGHMQATAVAPSRAAALVNSGPIEMIPMDEFRAVCAFADQLRLQRDAAVAEAAASAKDALAKMKERDEARRERDEALKQASDWKEIADDADKALQAALQAQPKAPDGTAVVRTIERLNSVNPDLARELAKLGKPQAAAR